MAVRPCASHEEYKDTIDLLLTDIVMPGMRGDDLVREIQKERPGIAALFISGYADLGKLKDNTPSSKNRSHFPSWAGMCVASWMKIRDRIQMELFN